MAITCRLETGARGVVKRYMNKDGLHDRTVARGLEGGEDVRAGRWY
jgi:hypothetical protein